MTWVLITFGGIFKIHFILADKASKINQISIFKKNQTYKKLNYIYFIQNLRLFELLFSDKLI